MAVLESDETFYLEPLIYPSNFSGTYRMTPLRETRLQCGDVVQFYEPGESYEISIEDAPSTVTTAPFSRVLA